MTSREDCIKAAKKLDDLFLEKCGVKTNVSVTALKKVLDDTDG